MGKWYEKREEQKQLLINASIKTVADRGLEQTFVDTICTNAGLNVVYLYRLFGNKDQLLLSAFEKIDNEFLHYVLGFLREFNKFPVNNKKICFEIFNHCWQYIIDRPDNLRFYVRFYHSATFHSIGYDDHIKRFYAIIQRLEPSFKANTDVTMVMHQVFETFIKQAIQHVAHPVCSNESAKNMCFNMIFSITSAFVDNSNN